MPRYRQGDEIGKYRLEEHLGTGGFGEVWRAENTLRLPDEPPWVALKILTGQQEQALRMLLQEATLLRSLQHPRIVRLGEINRHGGAVYLVMDLVRGGSLRRYLLNEPVPTRRRVGQGPPLQTDQALPDPRAGHACGRR